MTDERIGTTNADGSKSYPKVDINGASYSKPATTAGIGGGRFVVVPVGFKDFDMLEEFKPKPVAKPKPIKKDESESDDDASD